MKKKPSTPTQAIDVHMGEEKKNRKKNKNKQGAGPQPSIWNIRSSLTTSMDHAVGLF